MGNNFKHRFLLVISTFCLLFIGILNAKQPERYLNLVFENVNVSRNIVYGESVNETGKKENLLLDIYKPEGDVRINRPVILFIHGGGFTFGNDKSQKYIVEMANRFAKKGFVCISIDYRLRAKPKENMSATVSDAVSDAKQALYYLKKNKNNLGIDKSKIVICGGSAGGMLAVNLCYSNNFSIRDKDKKGIITLINLWGSPDMAWAKLTVTGKSIPAYIVHGTNDKLVPFNNSEKLVSLLKEKNVKNEFFIIEGGGHTPVDKMNEFEKGITDFIYSLF